MNEATTVKPLDGEYGLERKQLARYLNRVGRGINCRLDIPVLTVEDIKWAAKIFHDLYQQLTKIGFHDDRSDIWRILEARYAMEDAKRELHIRTNRKESIKAFKKYKDQGPYKY